MGCVVLGCGAAVCRSEPTPSPSPLRVNTLRPAVGDAVRLKLTLPGGESWRDANVGQFIIRAAGEQQAIEPTPGAAHGEVELTFDHPGTALVATGLGAADQKGLSDSWQRTPFCAKMIFRVAPKAGEAPPAMEHDSGVTGKVGQKIEIVPLIDPTRLRPGDDLPVRVYWEGAKLVGIAVWASVGGAAPVRTITDDVGSARFHVDRAGAWTIRFEKDSDGVTYVAELMFEVSTP